MQQLLITLIPMMVVSGKKKTIRDFRFVPHVLFSIPTTPDSSHPKSHPHHPPCQKKIKPFKQLMFCLNITFLLRANSKCIFNSKCKGKIFYVGQAGKPQVVAQSALSNNHYPCGCHSLWQHPVHYRAINCSYQKNCMKKAYL